MLECAMTQGTFFLLMIVGSCLVTALVTRLLPRSPYAALALFLAVLALSALAPCGMTRAVAIVVWTVVFLIMWLGHLAFFRRTYFKLWIPVAAYLLVCYLLVPKIVMSIEVNRQWQESQRAHTGGDAQ